MFLFSLLQWLDDVQLLLDLGRHVLKYAKLISINGQTRGQKRQSDPSKNTAQAYNLTSENLSTENPPTREAGSPSVAACWSFPIFPIMAATFSNAALRNHRTTATVFAVITASTLGSAGYYGCGWVGGGNKKSATSTSFWQREAAAGFVGLGRNVVGRLG